MTPEFRQRVQNIKTEADELLTLIQTEGFKTLPIEKHHELYALRNDTEEVRLWAGELLFDKTNIDGRPLSEVSAEYHSVRVMNEDGQGLMGTCDHLPNRLNVTVKDGVILSHTWG